MATKKIFDILPPQKRERQFKESAAGVYKIAEKPELSEKQESAQKTSSKSDGIQISPSVFDFRKQIIVILPVLALAGIFSLSVFFAKAEIEIWPKTDKLSFAAALNLDKNVKQFDLSAAVLPAEIIEREKTVSGNFPASGSFSKETKAQGIITVYNNYSTSPLVLVANTRFISTEGKLFRIPERIMIPGGTYESGKFAAGEVNVRVAADQPGAEYNIEPAAFSIPGFAGTDKYTKVYAKSFQPFAGGSLEKVAQVTAVDLDKAEEILTERAKSETEALLKSDLASENISSVFRFLENGIQTEILEKFSSAKTGGEAKEFTFQMKAKSKTMLFKKEDVENFAKNSILSRIAPDKKIHDPSLKIDYFPESINFASGTAGLALKISAKIYSDIDVAAFKKNISQKSLDEIKLFLASQPEIGRVSAAMWPLWVKKAPADIERIELRINFDPPPGS